MSWRDRLRFDPVAALLAADDPAIRFFVERDLLGSDPGPADALWELPDVRRILRRQAADGSWPSRNANRKRFPAVNYALVETWRHLRFLVDQYALDRSHPAAGRAAEYLFSCQTGDGDVRGILANQPAMYYTGAILALLARAGYADDPRVERGVAWLVSMRQDDGGWVGAPAQTLGLTGEESYRLSSTDAPPVQGHDRSRPFAHSATGMALRALADNPLHCRSEPAAAAARLLASRFFEADGYASYRHPDNWLRFDYPFWWNDLVAALDSVSRIGLAADDPHVARALGWLVDHQQATGLWKISYSRIHKAPPDSAKVRELQRWVSLAVCRVFARFGR